MSAFALELGLSFMIFTKKKDGVRAIRATNILTVQKSIIRTSQKIAQQV